MPLRPAKKIRLPYYAQKTDYYCGPAVLQMVLKYFNFWQPQKKIARAAGTNNDTGTDNHNMIKVATACGFYCYVNNNSTFFEIRHFLEKGLPVIVNYIEPTDNEGHFAVVSGITGRSITLNDPWNGRNFKLSQQEFLRRWHDQKNIHHEWIMVVAKEDFHLGKQYLPEKQKVKA